MAKRTVTTALALLAVLTLAGCWESSDVTISEPGEYKGAKDPLLSQQVSSRTEALHQRFQLVQADR